MFDDRRAARTIQFIELLKHTKSPFHGQPFTLLPWQRAIVSDVYGTINERGIRQYRYAYLEIPKKQGKSELTAALALYHLFADREVNGEVYSCAADREQASLVFDVAVDMVDQCPPLQKRCKLNVSTKLITDKVSGSKYKAVSSESSTKHGLNVSMCIFDELHAQPNRDLFDVMTKGAGDARMQPLWWIITTAGDDPDRKSIGWEVHERAAKIIQARDSGALEHDIPTWYPVIYAYEGEDIYNKINWHKANPSLGVTVQIDKMREAAQEAKQSKADERLFRWLRLNQWVTTKLSSWLPLDLWDATEGDWTRGELLGRECYMGGDFSTTTDLSAICLLFPPQQGDGWIQHDWRVIFDCWIPRDNMQDRIRADHVPYDDWAAQGWIYPTDGDEIDYTVIEERIEECRKLYKVKELDADKSFAHMLLQRLEQSREGHKRMDVVDIPQKYEYLTDPLNGIEILLRQSIHIPQPDGTTLEHPAITHEPHPVGRWCFGNASIAMNGNAQKKLVKEHRGKNVDRSKRIDLIAAWVNAYSRARFHKTNRSIYATRGIRTIGG
ncbi:MAG: terminase large subunit [Chloroflexi bacterium]|nr:terminase large subunit [Chloroflexota bacterium]